MEEQVTSIQMARRRYESVHKEERKEATGQFNTRLPRPLFEEINGFLKAHGIQKTELILAGYEALLRAEAEKETKHGIQESDHPPMCGR